MTPAAPAATPATGGAPGAGTPLRVFVNASAIGSSTGGTWAYLEGVLRGWQRGNPNDALAIDAHPSFPEGLERDLSGFATVRRGGGSRASVVLAQQSRTRSRARAFAADAVFNAALSAPLLGAGDRPEITMAHDIRHVERPQEFGRVALRYRKLVYERTIRRSAMLTCGSESTREAIVARLGIDPARVRAIPLGADHVDAWRRGPQGRHGVAFAHWSNKRPETAIRVWGDLARDPGFDRELHIVGAPADARAALEELAREQGVAQLVRVRARVPDREFEELLSGAAVLLFPSSLEGFGIPVVEAMRLGVPVVASAGAGMEGAGGKAALYADPEVPAEFATHCRRLWADDAYRDAVVRAGIAHSAGYTWAATAAATRTAISDAVARRS